MNARLQRLYRRFRSQGWQSRYAFHGAKTVLRWDTLESCGLVRLGRKPDDCCSFDDLDGDMFDPKCHPDIPESRLKREQTQYHETIERDGVWGIVGEYRTDPESDTWEHGGSVWGVVGESEDIDVDIMGETIDSLMSALKSRPARCKCCGSRSKAWKKS